MATPQKKQWNESKVKRSKNGRFAKLREANNARGRNARDGRADQLIQENNRRGGGVDSRFSAMRAENARLGTSAVGSRHTGSVSRRGASTGITPAQAASASAMGAQVRNRQFNVNGSDNIGTSNGSRSGSLQTSTSNRSQRNSTLNASRNTSTTRGSRTDASGLPKTSSSNGRNLTGFSGGSGGNTSISASNRQMESDYKRAVREQQARLASRNRTQSNSVAATNAVVGQHRSSQNSMGRRQQQQVLDSRPGQLDKKRRNRKIH